jgi:hypothetical protein
VPGGRRTERISERDLEVLEFIARFGVVPRDAVALWANTRRAMTLRRERRLRDAGLVRTVRPFGADGPFVVCTRTGLRAVGHEVLGPAGLSPATARHSAAAARLGAQLELAGERVLSERELKAREQRERERVFSAELSAGRFHRPDLVVLNGDPTAIEVELSEKAPARLDEILRGWRRAVALRKVAAVVYRCGPRARGAVERSAERTRVAGSFLRIEGLE